MKGRMEGDWRLKGWWGLFSCHCIDDRLDRPLGTDPLLFPSFVKRAGGKSTGAKTSTASVV